MRNWTEAEAAEAQADINRHRYGTGGYRGRKTAIVEEVPLFPPIPEPRRNKHPEVILQIAIVHAIRPLLLPGARLLGTNGELPGGAEMRRQAAKRKAMGYWRGTADLLAVRKGFHGWIEVKVPPNKPTPEQAAFARWAIDECEDGWAVVTSVADAVGLLEAWHGFLES